VASLLLNFLFSLPCVLLVNLAVAGKVRVPPAAGLLGATYVGLFEMGFTFVLWLRALRLSSSTAKVSNLIFFSPFLSLVLIHFLVGEAIRASTLVGLVLIVAGNVLQQLGRD
jgi:drug/metabolite transporter (DMT)-like permease